MRKLRMASYWPGVGAVYNLYMASYWGFYENGPSKRRCAIGAWHLTTALAVDRRHLGHTNVRLAGWVPASLEASMLRGLFHILLQQHQQSLDDSLVLVGCNLVGISQ